MKTVFTTIGILLASMASAATAAGSGLAKETGKTRTEVRAELMSAISKGERLSAGEAQYDPPMPVLFSRSRAQVRSEVIGALRAGERLSAGEASYEAPVTAGAGRNRAEVMGELRAMGAGPGVPMLGSGPGADTIYLPGPN